jgi:hypothetical protein
MIEYEHLVHGRRPVGCKAESGVYWIGLVNDLTEGLKLMRDGRASLHYLRPYVHPHVFDFLDLRDPRPFMALAGDRLRRFGSKRLRPRRAPVGGSAAPVASASAANGSSDPAMVESAIPPTG